MVGRALDGEIERDLQAVRRAPPRRRRRKSVERAEFGMDRIVAALRAADRIGAAGIARRGVQRCCCGPCGWSRRSDGSAGNTARRSPWRGSPAAGGSRRRRCRAAPGRRSPSAGTARTSWRTPPAGDRHRAAPACAAPRTAGRPPRASPPRAHRTAAARCEPAHRAPCSVEQSPQRGANAAGAARGGGLDYQPALLPAPASRPARLRASP